MLFETSPGVVTAGQSSDRIGKHFGRQVSVTEFLNTSQKHFRRFLSQAITCPYGRCDRPGTANAPSKFKGDPEMEVNFSPVKLRWTCTSSRNYAHLIRNTQSLDAFLHVSAICADASSRLPESAQAKLIEELQCSPSIFSQYVKIGQDKRLWSQEVYPHLPAVFGALHCITAFSSAQIEKSIREGVIHPRLNFHDLVHWMKREGITRPRSPRRKQRRFHQAGIWTGHINPPPN